MLSLKNLDLTRMFFSLLLSTDNKSKNTNITKTSQTLKSHRKIAVKAKTKKKEIVSKFDFNAEKSFPRFLLLTLNTTSFVMCVERMLKIMNNLSRK